MEKRKSSYSWIFILIIVYLLYSCLSNFLISFFDLNDNPTYSSKVFRLISISAKEVFDKDIKSIAKKKGFSIDIEYEDTLKITKRLNSGEMFDAVWLSNSIWMYSLDSSKVRVSDTKSTSINPIVFGIRKSKAEELGFLNKTLYTQDIVDAVFDGKLKFNMSNPVTTNSGASAYLGILTTLAGNPEVLTKDMLENDDLKEKLKSFFSGVERSSGDEDYLEEMFLKGDYEAVFTYESSIININQKLKKSGKEVLYALYPVDGVSISDSPIGYIDQKDEKKKDIYQDLVEFLSGKDGQKLLANYGRRTWYGGVSSQVDQTIFNSEWGIDTTKYISPLKFPSTSVIRSALSLYQSVLRKPVHVVFCLDYSGSMAGDRISELRDAMDYILSDRAEADLLQFSDDDIVDVIPFSSSYGTIWHSKDAGMNNLLNKINEKSPSGGTALFLSAAKGIELLASEDQNHYNTSVVVMTDGAGNVGSYEDLKKAYQKYHSNVPIYSIQFGNASSFQLNQMANLSNGKVFDGTSSLVDAFMEVRGYN